MKERLQVLWVVETVLDVIPDMVRVGEFEWCATERSDLLGVDINRSVLVNDDASVHLRTLWEIDGTQRLIETPWHIDLGESDPSVLRRSFLTAVSEHILDIARMREEIEERIGGSQMELN